jgi:hypothetical protein
MSPFVDNLVSGRDLTFNLQFQRDEETGWFAACCRTSRLRLSGGDDRGGNGKHRERTRIVQGSAARNGRTESSRAGTVSVESLADNTARLLVRPRFEIRA